MRTAPMTDADLAALEGLLDALPAPLEPLDVSMLDGYLVGVLLQPERIADERWLAHVHDADGRPAPAAVDLAALHGLVLRRHGELNRAITTRQWFDPWVFELDDEAEVSAAVLPWAAGFALAMDLFPRLSQVIGAMRPPWWARRMGSSSRVCCCKSGAAVRCSVLPLVHSRPKLAGWSGSPLTPVVC